MSKMQANLCLLCVTLLWSTEVIIFACIPTDVVPFATTAITNLIGAALLILCFFKRIRSAIRKGGKKLLLRGLLLGVLNCSYNVLYLYGLDDFDVSTGAFTLSITVVVLPVLLLMRKTGVSKKTWISAGFVLIGILVALAHNLINISVPGLLTITAGCIIRAFFISQLNRYAREYDPVSLTSLLSLTVGIISYIIWLFVQPTTFAAIPWNSQIIASLFIHTYFVVALAQTLNTFAQRRATPASATIIYSMEILFSVIWGAVLPGTLIDRVVPDAYIMIGVVFIVFGNIIEIIDFSKFRRRKEARDGTA